MKRSGACQYSGVRLWLILLLMGNLCGADLAAAQRTIMNVTLNSYYIPPGSWPNDIYWDGRGASVVQLVYNAALSATWTFSGFNILTAIGHSCDLSAGGQIVVESGSTLILSNIRMRSVGGNNIRCADATAQLILDDCELNLSSDYSFTVGSLTVNNDVTFRGTSVFTYATSQTSTINLDSTLAFNDGISFNYSPLSLNNALLYCVAPTSVVSLSDAQVCVGDGGLCLTGGTLQVAGKSSLDIGSTGTLVLGNNTPAGDMQVVMQNGANFTINQGTLCYNNCNPIAWRNQTESNSLIIESGAFLYVNSSLGVGQGSISMLTGTNLLLHRAIDYYTSNDLVIET